MSSEARLTPPRRWPLWLAGLASALVGSSLQGSLLWDLSQGKGPSEGPFDCSWLEMKPPSELTEREREFLAQSCPKDKLAALRERANALPEVVSAEDKGPQGQVIEIDMADHDPSASAKEVTRLANQTIRVKEETSAPSQPKPERKPSKPAGSEGASPKTDATPKPEGQPEAQSKDPEQGQHERAPTVLSSKDGKGGVVGRDYSVGGALASYKAFAGQGAGAGGDGAGGGDYEYAPDVAPGQRTVLNANAYRFADFFNGVRNAVARHWKPAPLYRQRDPSGTLYGVKDRRTVLRVELGPNGEIQSLLTVQACGLDFMDEEAIRAMKAAAPFVNPPKELFNKDGVIRFEFGFYFEISGKQRFNWRRL